jgi:hypothetical protein
MRRFKALIFVRLFKASPISSADLEVREERKGIGTMPFNKVVTVKRDTREFNIREPKAQVSDHCILNGSIPEIGSGVRGEQRNPETPRVSVETGVVSHGRCVAARQRRTLLGDTDVLAL